jgi:hypothetical protein
MGTPPLSHETLKRLNIVFVSEERAIAERLLVEHCGNNLPFLEKGNDVELERYRFAALKLSHGTIKGLEAAIKIAKEDWRDLLMAAGFGEDETEHERWMPKRKN